jgi:Protein kinase domain/Calx-beta domain
MNSLTEPVAKPTRAVPDTRTAAEWLDALSTGTCDPDFFLRGVSDVLQRAPDTGWELLALLDQYYRRGKIGAEMFGNLKTHLQNLLMGKARRGEISVPLPRTRDEQPMVTTAMSRAMPASGVFADNTPVLGRPPAAVSAPMAPATANQAPTSFPVSAPRPERARAAVSGPTEARPRAAVSTPVVAPMPSAPEREAANAAQRGPEYSLAVGDVLRGRYRVQGLLGQGGMGTVFEAIDQYRLDRSNGDQKVAIKVLHTAVIQRPRLFSELRREFQHLQSLSHPNIVRVHEFDRDGDIAFFTMEYLSGALLSRVLPAHEVSPLYRPYALAIIRDVGAAVAHAHARGIVHGDLNPGNIFITDNGEVRVLDFGASHQLRRGPWISEFESPEQITVATTSYASCQLLEGETADVRDDVYALACISYVLLTGNHPFREHSALKARTLRLTLDRPRTLNRRQWNALRAGLQFERERRPSDMQAWLGQFDFRTAAAHLPVLPTLSMRRPRRRNGARWMALAGALGLILVCAGWAATHVDSLELAGATVGAAARSAFANTVVSQLWDTQHEDGGDIQPTTPAPAGNAAPEAPVAITHKPSPVTAMSTTRNAPRPPLGVLAPTSASAAPAVGSAAAVNGASGQAGYPAHARIELAADTVDVPSTEPVAHVIVRRSRTSRGDVSFSWWTESGTAKPGRDFEPVKLQVEHIEDGRNEADLVIPIVLDPARQGPRSFYVVIDEPSDNATLGTRTLTMVTLLGSSD